MTWPKQTPVLQPQKDCDWEQLRNLHKIQPPTRQKEENTNFNVEGKRGKWGWMLLSVLLLCEIKKRNKNNPLKLGRCKVSEKKNTSHRPYKIKLPSSLTGTEKQNAWKASVLAENTFECQRLWRFCSLFLLLLQHQLLTWFSDGETTQWSWITPAGLC